MKGYKAQIGCVACNKVLAETDSVSTSAEELAKAEALVKVRLIIEKPAKPYGTAKTILNEVGWICQDCCEKLISKIREIVD